MRRTLILPMPDRHLPWNLAQSRAELRAELALIRIAHQGQREHDSAAYNDGEADHEGHQSGYVVGSERPYVRQSARERFARGVDTLWNEQGHAWALQHARNERVGPWSRARAERRTFGSRIIRGLRAEVSLAERFRIAAQHRVNYPRSYFAADLDTFSSAELCAVYRSWARSDVLPWNADDCAAHELTGREPRHTRDLERAADALLRHADLTEHHHATIDALERGEPSHVPDRPSPWPRLDVIDRWTKRLTVAPDRVAYRGGSVLRKRGGEVRGGMRNARYEVYSVETGTGATRKVRRVVVPRDTRVRYVSKPVSVYSPDALIASATIGIAPRKITSYRTERIGRGFAWHGFVKVANPSDAERKAAQRKRDAVRKPKRDSETARGPAVKPWSLADRSLTRRWIKADAGQRAAAETLTAILATSTRGVVLDLGEHFHAVTPDGSTVYLADEQGTPRTRTFTLQAFARRAALAREDIA